MTHPDVDQEAVDQLRRRVGASTVEGTTVTEDVVDLASPQGHASTSARLKAKARSVATPVVAKVRYELDRATGGEVDSLRAEVAELRAEVSQLRAEHAAALAALQEDRR